MSFHDIKIHLAASQIQRKSFNNSQHLVLPVVMLTVGVHAGSGGPLFYPGEELRHSAHLWDGKPVLVNHPTNGGQPVSANSPQVWEGQVLGQVWNSTFDGNRLKAEIWLNEERTRTIAPELLKLINHGANIDVSTGLFTTDDQSPGVWNGEHYSAIARWHVPDHLAILPEQRGACSWQQGCGIRANTKQNDFDAYFRNYINNHIKNGGITMKQEETPLAIPTLNEAPKENAVKPDEYDMDISQLWRTK